MRIGKWHFHFFSINEREKRNGRAHYWSYWRRFLHVYKVYPDGMERSLWDGHVEYSFKKVPSSAFSLRFHIGNAGSETPWDGHIYILWFNFYWGHSGFRKLADWLTRCSGYKYDTREWSLRAFDNRLWWEFANHSDMCDLGKGPNPGRGKKYRRRTWRRGSINLSIPEAIWGPKRYSYEDVETFNGLVKLPEDSYAVVVRLQRQYLGRTKVAKRKHIQTWCLDVDAPTGIPTHPDHSGGWKGDRTYGFGCKFAYPSSNGWQIDAIAAVTAWVLNERARTGFRKPDPVEDAA